MAYGSADSGFGGGASVFYLDASHADTVFIPDADLLFNGAFKRHGPDLILTGHDGDRHVVPGYFSGEHHPALVAPNGARLSAALVDLLAGSSAPNEYAQAASTTPASPIGKVEKIVGHVVVFRNGVEVALNVGDAVYKGDVIQTGVNSTCGVDFPDGTALNLVANTRMALSEFSFDPNSHSNDALFSLVQGTFAFVAGKVAHTGDMKIETPVATMGIRGTTGFVQEQVATISANAGNVTYSFAVVEDYATNRVGSYELVDNNPNSPTYGQVVVLVSQNGFLTSVTPQGANLPPIVTTQPMTNSQLGFEQQIIDQLFAILNSGNANPQSTPGAPGSSTPPDDMPRFLQLLQNDFGNTYTFNVANGGYGQTPVSATIYGGGGTAPNNPGPGPGPGQQNTSTVFIWTAGTGTWTTPTWSQPGIPNASIDTVRILSGPLTYDANYTIGSLYVAPGVVFDIVGGSLTVLGTVDDEGTMLVTGDPPALKIEGPLKVGSNSELHVSGAGDIIDIDNSADNLGVIAATHRGKIVFNHSDLTNEGTLKAADGGKVAFENATIDNQDGGRILAKDGGVLRLDGTTFMNEQGAILGAVGFHSRIDFVNFGGLDNSGTFLVADHARAALDSVQTTNEAGAGINATDHARITIDGGTFNNYGTVLAEHDGVIAFGNLPGNPLPVTNFAGGKIEAKDHGSITFDDINVTNDADAVIEAKDGLILFKESPGGAPGGVTNDGAILARGGGTVVFAGVRASDTGGLFNNGIIAAIGCGSSVDFFNSVIKGGTLKADAGEIFVNRESTIIGTVTVDISNGGLAHFADVVNANANIVVTFGCGGGTLELDQAPATGGSAAPVTISGFGLGDTLDLTNLQYSSHELVYYCDGVLTVVDGCTSESFTLTCGDYSACDFVLVEDASGGTEVVLADFAVTSGDWKSVCTWSNGVPRAEDTAVIDRNVSVQLDSHAKIENLIVDKCATLDICDCGELTVLNALDDSGRIDVGTDSSFGDTTFRVDGPVDVKRSGEIVAREHHSAVDFSSDDIDNSGLIKAERQGSVSFDRDHVDNSGRIEAKYGGTVAIDHSTIDNWHGTIAAIGCDAKVELADSFIGGGTLKTDNGGVIETVYGRSTLDGVAVWNSGTMQVEADATLVLEGTTIVGGVLKSAGIAYDNEGVFEVSKTGGTSTFDGTTDALTVKGFVELDKGASLELQGDIDLDSARGMGIIQLAYDVRSAILIDGCVTLSGDGYIALEGSKSSIVADGSAALTNDSNIFGGGNIGERHGSLTFDNNGLVDATFGDTPLVIDTGTTTTNTGTLEATSSSELDLYGTFDNHKGTIAALEDGGGPPTVKLFGATIQGGTLQTDGDVSGASVIEVTAGQESVFDGLSQKVNVNGYVNVDSGATLELKGTIDTAVGTINVDGSSATDLLIDGTVKLIGSGWVTLTGSADEITGANTGMLDNIDNIDNTISGAGYIGDQTTDLALDNENTGTVSADLSGQILTVETGWNQITNAGTFAASNGGILDIDSTVNNAGGLLQVGPNSTISVADAITGGKATIDGGILEFDSSSNVNVTFIGGGGTRPNGELILGDALAYKGSITGFDGSTTTDSDSIDLVGITESEINFKQVGANTVITIKVGMETNKITLDAFTVTNLSESIDTSGTGTLLTDPPSNSSNTRASISINNDTFNFHSSLGADTGNANAPNTSAAHNHFVWAHDGSWSTLAAETPASVPADVAAQIDAHWHHALQNAVHLH